MYVSFQYQSSYSSEEDQAPQVDFYCVKVMNELLIAVVSSWGADNMVHNDTFLFLQGRRIGVIAQKD